MSEWLHLLGRKMLNGAAGLFPGYFAVVMATGAMAVSAHILNMALLSKALLLAGFLAYGALWCLTFVRVIKYPDSLVGDITSHARGPGFFTLVASTCILGSAVHLILGWADLAKGFWWLGIGLWVGVMYAFFLAVTVREEKPTLTEGINGAWLLAAVGTQSVSVLTTLLPWPEGWQPVFMLVAVSFYLLGCMLYLSIITLIFYRLTFLKITVEAMTPPYWINMGAVAITTLAGSTLIVHSQKSALLTDLVPFIKGFTLLYWVTGTWWIPLLVGLTLWRHFFRHHPLRYTPQLWSMVFPLAMYTTGTLRLSEALELPFLVAIPKMFFWLALSAWAVTSIGLWRFLWREVHSHPG